MRHAVAVPPGTPGYLRDAQRPLTEEGLRQAERVARGLQRLGVVFDAVATSGLVRAVQTATRVARVYGWREPFDELDALTPEADPAMTSLALKAFKGRAQVLLVGHEPHLSAWLGLLIGGPAGARCQMKKAAVACVEIEHAPPTAGSGVLKWLLPPKPLSLIGKT